MGGHGKRKRKVAVATINEEKENESDTSTVATNEPAYNNGPMYKIMSHVQTSEALHKKYVKDLQQLYAKMDHDAFVVTFIHMIKAAMACDEANEYAMTSLQFCAKFIASFDNEETHPVLASIFEWLLGTISNNPHIRFRLCQFINMILNALGVEAALDDIICDKILEYMVDRLLDCSPNVRLQAILAMQRLQVPDNPDDAVVRAYQFHLSSDPSPRVRMAVITCMGRNVLTIPYILDRLSDIDEKVRRHTYLQMSSYPVRSYKVSQRLLLLEQGLNDRCEAVRKVASRIMLQQWFESYKKDLLQLIAALKLDATEADIERFRKVTKQTLIEIFKREDPKFLIDLLPFDPEMELHRCVPYDKLQMEVALYWQCLSEYLQNQQSDEFDLILPELSVFCTYTEKFCTLQKSDMDKFENLEFQYKLLPLLEILYNYDLGDEIGRGNFKKLLEFLLKNVNLNDKNVEIIIRCAENIITDQNERMQLLIGIVSEICQLNPAKSNLWQDRTLVNEAMSNCTDSVLKMKLSKLKVKLLELEEQEMTLLEAKNFVQAEKVTNEKNTVTEEFSNLLKPLLAQPLDIRKVKNEDIITGLQIIFHMIVSKKVRSLSSQSCQLYNDFILRQMASTTTTIRIWALKCGTAFSMHFEPIAKEVFNELFSQFFKHCIERIWECSVKCIFGILDLYGTDKFERAEQTLTSDSNVTSRRAGRLLYNTIENIDLDDGDQQVQLENREVGFIQLMSHFLDSLSTDTILNEIVLGFIRLILHGHINRSDIIEKLLLRYFNPTTNTKTNQYLSIFMEEMIRLRKQVLLVPSLLPTINAVLTAPYDSPLLEIRPETITRFFIDITRQDSVNHPNRHNNLHNKIAHDFLTEMTNNVNNREISKLLSKEILKLELNISNNPKLKNEMKEMTEKLLTCEFDAKTLKCLSDFKDMLDGRFTRAANAADSEEEADDETVTNETQPRTNNSTPAIEAVTTTSSTTTPVPTAIAEESESTLTETQIEVAGVETNPPSSEKDKNNTENVPEAIVSADESVASGMENNSQPSVASSNSQPNEEQVPAAKVQTPTITTFGHQNKIGQRCLRRSLNNSCTQSESDASDVPRIRIELRIDSDKKKKPSERPNTETKKKNPQTAAAPKGLNSVSSRSLRMLSRQQKPKSPVATKQRNKNQETRTTTNIVTTEGSSSEELNNSEVITQSPQASVNVTARIFPSTRQRRGNATALQSASTPNKQANANSSTRQSTQKEPVESNIPNETSPRAAKTPQKQVSKTPGRKTKTPKAVEKTSEQSSKTTSPKAKTTEAVEKTPERVSRISPKTKTPSAVEKTPQQQRISKTPSPKTKTPRAIEKTPQPVSKTPSPKTRKTSMPAEKTKQQQQQASENPSLKTKTPTTASNTTSSSMFVQIALNTNDKQSEASNSAKKTPNRLPPRKAIYASRTTTLQRTGRKRQFPKTPIVRKSTGAIISPSRCDSSSSNTSTSSPQPKQLRRSIETPKIPTPTQQKRLTAKDIESLLNEDSDSSSNSSRTQSPSKKSPTKNLKKPKATTTVKKGNKATNQKNAVNNRRKSSTNELSTSNFSSEDTSSNRARNTRNTTRETFRQQNIMTRKRKSLYDSSSSSSTTTSRTLPKKQAPKQLNTGPSRIPIKASQSSSTASMASSRSSSASPLRGRCNVSSKLATDGFKQPALRSNSVGRPRLSRIPRKLP